MSQRETLETVNWMWECLQTKCFIEEMAGYGILTMADERWNPEWCQDGIGLFVRGFFLGMGRGVSDAEMQHIIVMVLTEVGIA